MSNDFWPPPKYTTIVEGRPEDSCSSNRPSVVELRFFNKAVASQLDHEHLHAVQCAFERHNCLCVKPCQMPTGQMVI